WDPSSLKKEDDEDVSEGWLKGQISYRKDPYYSRSEESDLSDFSERSPEQFFTFNRKNEEFQKLLDAEYERLMSVRKGFEAPEPVKPEPPAPSNVDFSGSGDDLESKLDALFGPVGGSSSRSAGGSASERRAQAPKAEPFAPLEPAPWDTPKTEPSAAESAAEAGTPGDVRETVPAVTAAEAPKAEPPKMVPAEPVRTGASAEPVKTAPVAAPLKTIPDAEFAKTAAAEKTADTAPAAEPAKAEPVAAPVTEPAPADTARFVQPPASGDRSRMGDEDLITALFGEIPEDRKHLPPAFAEKPEPAPEPEPAPTPEQELEAKTRSFREELSAGEKRLDTLEARLERLQREVEARRQRAAEEAKDRAAESAKVRTESAAGESEAMNAASAAAAAASVQAAGAAAASESVQPASDPFSDPWKQPFSTTQKYYENSGIRAEVPEDAAKGEAGRAFDQLIEAAAAAAGRKPFESVQEQQAEDKPAEAEPAYTEVKPEPAYTDLKPEPPEPASETPASSEPVKPEANIAPAPADEKPAREEYEFSYRQKDMSADVAAASKPTPADQPASTPAPADQPASEAAAPAPEAEEQPKDNFEKFFEGHEEPEEGKKHPVLAALLVLALLLGLLKGSSWALGRFLPDAGITQTVSALDDSVSGAFSSAKSSVMSLLGKEKAPDLSATGGVDLQALLSEYNRNIKSVSVDLEKLALTENTECGIETLADSEKVEDPALMAEAYKTMILYNSSWIDYVNKGDETTLSYMKADGAAYRGAVNFDRESVGTETFGEMVLGEVRKAGEELYVFVRESITVSKDNKNRNASYDWVYILEKVGEEYKVVDCKAFK
ncbi:MAG: hypothetical protein II488_07060, partial [Firmicutes bacterium]|nr:hypothetical protein [Bacillota bacterium]